MINKLLSELNRIWRDRERKQINRLKNKSHNEVNQLRRQLAMRAPHDEVQSQKQISRLKHDLRSCQTDLRDTKAMLERRNEVPQGVDMIDHSLKVANAM